MPVCYARCAKKAAIAARKHYAMRAKPSPTVARIYAGNAFAHKEDTNAAHYARSTTPGRTSSRLTEERCRRERSS